MNSDKYICIKQLIYYKLDGSINQTESGGLLEYEVGKEYECIKETDNWGTYYKIIHHKNEYITLWESEINKKDVRLTHSDKLFDKFFKIVI